MVHDEFLQFGDAAALNEKQSLYVASVDMGLTEASVQTNVMYTVHI